MQKDPNNKSDSDLAPSKEELDALFRDMPIFGLKGVRRTLEQKSKLFKNAWLLLMFLTMTYLMGWFSGLVQPYMTAGVTGEYADYQIHQIRFLMAFVLITIGTISINFNWQIERVLTVIAWVQTYFIFSGIIRQWRTLPDDRLFVIGAYSLNLLVILGLILVLIFEERRLNRD